MSPCARTGLLWCVRLGPIRPHGSCAAILAWHGYCPAVWVDRVLPPQFQDGVDVHIVVVESQRMGGVEGLDVLDPPQVDRAVDPAVD
jgi:hypothetical protein